MGRCFVFILFLADKYLKNCLTSRSLKHVNNIRHIFSILSAKTHKIGLMKRWILALCLLLGQAVAQEIRYPPQQIGFERQKRDAEPRVHKPRPLRGQKHPPPPEHRKEPLGPGRPGAPQNIHDRLHQVHKHAKKTHLSMTETKRVLSAANVIRRQLELGPTVMVKTPQGKRLGVLLQYQGKAVAVAFVHSDGQLVKLHRSPLLSHPSPVPVLNLTARQSLKQQLSMTSLSGAIAVTPRHYRVLLITEGTPVAVLRLKQQDLKPIFKPRDLHKPK